MLPPSAYCYEVEQFDEDPAAAGQIGTAPYDRVRRRKGIYTRDKNRLFLKQFVAPGIVIGIKVKIYVNGYSSILLNWHLCWHQCDIFGL